MAESDLPREVAKFLLVGRIVERKERGATTRGVVKFVTSKYGTGLQHAGLKCGVDTDFEYSVEWEGQDGLETMSLKEAQAAATAEFTDAEWLPPAIRTLLEDGWDGTWEGLDGRNVILFIEKHRKVEEASQKATKAAGKKAAGGVEAAKAPKAAAPKQRRAAAKKEQAPLAAPKGLAEALQAKRAKDLAERKRKAAAAAAAGSPPAKRSALTGALAPAPRSAAAAAAGGGVPAAAAATVVPSGTVSPAGAGRGEPAARNEVHSTGEAAAAGPSNRQPIVGQKQQQQRQQKQQQAEEEEQQQGVSESMIAGPSGGKGKQAAGAAAAKGKQAMAAAAAGKAASAAKGKQQRLLTSPLKSVRSNSGGRPVHEVLLQHERPHMAPRESKRLAMLDTECVEAGRELVTDTFWFDRVLGEDGVIYRAYSLNLILPEGKCFKPSKDKRLRTWKVKQTDAEDDYGVEAILAERQDEKRGFTRYLVKWQGYEADPESENWVQKAAMSGCKDRLKEWETRGRDAWQAASQRLLQEASGGDA